MHFNPQYSSEKILIYGYGVEGKSTESFFRKWYPNTTISLFDANIESISKEPLFAEYDVIIVSPGISWRKIPLHYRNKCTSQFRIFGAHISDSDRNKIIGITGTKGKSTTTTFLVEVLKKAKYTVQGAGNIGVPFLDVLETLPHLDYLILELSSYQLENGNWSPHLAICTNLYEDHLNRHGTLLAYHQAKKNLWKFQKPADILYAPAHQKELFLDASNLKISQPISLELCPRKSVFSAKHWRENFGMVLDLALDLEIHQAIVKEALQSLTPLAHRMQEIKIGKRIYVNDSISTNVKSSLAAITHYQNDLKTLLIGGKDRGFDYKSFFEILLIHLPEVQIIALPGETQSRFQSLGKSLGLQIIMAQSMQEAIDMANQFSNDGVVLLSPAAASFGLYKNYIERGNDFLNAINMSQK